METLNPLREFPRSCSNNLRMTQHSDAMLLGGPKDHFGIKIDKDKYYSGITRGLADDKPVLTGNVNRVRYFYDRAEADKALRFVRKFYPTAYIQPFTVQVVEVAA